MSISSSNCKNDKNPFLKEQDSLLYHCEEIYYEHWTGFPSISLWGDLLRALNRIPFYIIVRRFITSIEQDPLLYHCEEIYYEHWTGLLYHCEEIYYEHWTGFPSISLWGDLLRALKMLCSSLENALFILIFLCLYAILYGLCPDVAFLGDLLLICFSVYKKPS